jgi:FkbM family methyltransferase
MFGYELELRPITNKNKQNMIILSRLNKRIKGNEKLFSPFNKVIKTYLNPNELDSLFIVDIGANRGDFFNECCDIFNQTKIKGILVEPIPECFDILIEKFSRNHNVRIYNNAVSDNNGIVEFFINKFDETSSLLKIKEEMKELSFVNTKLNRVINIETLKLDDILKNNTEIIDLLKIDVQGTEHKVLNGAVNSSKFIKYIWTEVSFKALYEGSSTFQEVYDKLLSLGFILLEITEGHRAPNNELLQANCLFRNILL